MTFDNEYMNLHFDNEEDIHFNSENHEENGHGYDLEMLIILHYIVCFISYKKWVQRE